MVSVIIPTYKRANYIERAINSVLAQTYTDYEIIIVDDNDHNTEDRKILENIMNKDGYKNNSKIKYIQHDKNRNGAAARNTGLKVSKGEYVTFLDDDDLFFKDRLEILVKSLDENPEYNAAYTGCLICKNGYIKSYKNALKSGDLQKDTLMQNSFFGTGSNMFFRKKSLEDINGFDETFKRHQDLEVFVRYFRDNKILAINEILVIKDNDSRINSPNIERSLEYREYYMQKFIDDIQIYSDNKDIYISNYFELLCNAVRANNKEYKNIIEKKLNTYTKLTTNMKLKLMYSRFDKYIPFKGSLRYIKNKKICNKINKAKLNEFEQLINNNHVKGIEKNG